MSATLIRVYVQRREVSLSNCLSYSGGGEAHEMGCSWQILLDSILDESCVFVFLGFRCIAFVAPLATPRHHAIVCAEDLPGKVYLRGDPGASPAA